MAAMAMVVMAIVVKTYVWIGQDRSETSSHWPIAELDQDAKANNSTHPLVNSG